MRILKEMMMIANSVKTIICTILIMIFIFVVIDVVGFDGKISDLVKSIVAVIGSTCVAWMTLLYSRREKDKELSLRHITEKRLEWINDTRNLTSELCECLAQFIYSDIHNKEKIKAKIGGVLANLYMRYNLNDENDRVLLNLLDVIFVNVLYYGDSKRSRFILINASKYLTIHSQIYFKVEWERVKLETGYTGDEEKKDGFVKEKMNELRINLYEQEENNSKSYDEILKDGLSGLSPNAVYKKMVSKSEAKCSKSKKQVVLNVAG